MVILTDPLREFGGELAGDCDGDDDATLILRLLQELCIVASLCIFMVLCADKDRIRFVNNTRMVINDTILIHENALNNLTAIVLA